MRNIVHQGTVESHLLRAGPNEGVQATAGSVRYAPAARRA